jgi:hypothetical protein
VMLRLEAHDFGRAGTITTFLTEEWLLKALARSRLQDFNLNNQTMKIVVIGGTGLIGSKLVPKLREHSTMKRRPAWGITLRCQS